MLVLDASAGMCIGLECPESRALSSLMYEGEKAIAPQLYYAEVTQALWKHVRGGLLPVSEAQERLQRVTALVDEFVPLKDLLNEVFTESLRLDHSSHDVFYFVLARRNAATLCTLDRRLQQLCLKNGVNCVCGLDVDDERWTVRVEAEVGPAGMGGITREELERAVCRDANGV